MFTETSNFPASDLAPPGRSSSLFYCLVGVAGVLGMLVFSEETDLAMVVALSTLQLFPLLLIVAQNRPSFLGLTLAAQFFYYTFNSKLVRYYFLPGTTGLDDTARRSVEEYLICTTLMVATYYAGRSILLPKERYKEPLALLRPRPDRYVILYGLLATFPFLEPYLPSSIRTVTLSLPIVLVVLLSTCEAPFSATVARAAKYGLLAVCLIHFLHSEFLMLVLMLLSTWVAVAILRAEWRSLIGPAMIITIMLPIQMVKSDFRSRSINAPSINEKAELLAELLSNKEEAMLGLSGEAVAARADAGLSELNETSDIASAYLRAAEDPLEVVLKYTPSNVPFWDGETYASLPYLFVPRALYPDKPKQDFFNKFGRLYGIIHEEDDSTSIAISFFSEGYFNYGFTGLYLSAVAFGLILLIFERLASELYGKKYLFTYIAYLSPVLNIGLNASTVITQYLILTVLMLCLRTYLKPNEQ